MMHQSQSDRCNSNRWSASRFFKNRWTSSQTLFGLALAAFLGLSGNLRAQINQRDLAPLGLELMWENSIGGAGLVQGADSLVVWPHSSERREYVDVFVGNRLIERIDARRVDRDALEKRILEGKSASSKTRQNLRDDRKTNHRQNLQPTGDLRHRRGEQRCRHGDRRRDR
jgi:hypothetical protein